MKTFHQLFDADTGTYTYLAIDEGSRAAVAIDPVDGQLASYLELIAREGLRLEHVLETHLHADHVTAAGALARATGAKVQVPAGEQIEGPDHLLFDGDVIRFGRETIVALHTPGHTAGSMCYRWGQKLFSGDTLLIDGCGRTDLPGGDAGILFDSITARLFVLPDETVVYPGHDYRGGTSSTIGAERRSNSRLANRARPQFIEIMNNLGLAAPRMIGVALPANRRLGLLSVNDAESERNHLNATSPGRV